MHLEAEVLQEGRRGDYMILDDDNHHQTIMKIPKNQLGHLVRSGGKQWLSSLWFLFRH